MPYFKMHQKKNKTCLKFQIKGKAMNIGIDIDDTIANTNTSIDTFAKEYTEKVLKRKRYTLS
mgnify:CR=1 FL=1